MGRPKHTLPPVHQTAAKRPRWFFRAQVDVTLGPGITARRERPYYLGYCKDVGKRAAEKQRDAICAQLNNRPELIQSQTKFGLILDAYELDYLRVLKPNTRLSYRTHLMKLRAAFGDRRVCDIGPQDAQRWINSLEASGTQKVCLSVLRSVFERAAAWGYTAARNPGKDVIIPEALPVQERRAFTAAEYLRIRAAIRPPLDCAVDVAAFCGLRVGEIAAMSRASLDYEAGTITVLSNMGQGGEVSTPKNRKRRTVPMGWLRDDLLHWCRADAPASQSVFQLGYAALQARLDRALVAAGISFPGAGWHCFRRLYATNARRFLEMADVQYQMGHAYRSMTEQYIDEPSQERREAAMEAMRKLIFFEDQKVGRA